MSHASANGAHETAAAVVHIDPAHPDFIHLSDAELLFRGTLHRAGADLHLSHGDAHAVIAGYFASEHPATLVGPNGGRLTADVVALLAGPEAPGHYAQAQPDGTASDAHVQHDAIGRIEKVVGDVTVVRNGVAVELHIGDAVYKGDIVQTGSASAAGIAFPDGTALNLVPNTRMTLNQYSYGAHAGSNAALFTLIDGTFAFVAGKVAQSGDMKIATPVATMAVHGATGWAHELTPSEIATVSAKLGSVTYSFAVMDDHGADTHAIYDLLVDGSIVGSINDPNLVWYFDKAGNLISMPLNDSERSFADGLFSDFYDWRNDVVTQSLGVRGSGSPIDQPTFPDPVKLDGNVPSFDFSVLSGGSNGLFGLSPLSPFLLTHVPSDLFIWNGFGNWDQQVSDWNQGFAPTVAVDIVIIQSGKSSYDNAYTIGSLTVDFGAILNIIGGSLTVPAINNAGLIQINSSGSDPALVIEGAFDLTGGGAIHMLGPASENFILGLAGSGATLTNVDNTIAGSGNIGAADRNLTFVNEATVDATPLLPGDSGLLTVHTGNAVDNLGLLEATFGGELVVDDRLLNSNLVEAIGAGSSVLLDNGSAGTGRVLSPEADINSGTIEAVLGGNVELLDDGIDNEHGGLIGATGIGAQVELGQSLIQNDGEIAAAQAGLVAFDRDRIENESDGLIEATGRHSEVDLEHSRITNRGEIGADQRGHILFARSGVDNRHGGVIEADGRGSEVTLQRDDVDNHGVIEALKGGEVRLGRSLIQNSDIGTIEARGRGSKVFFVRDHVDNSGLIEAGRHGKIDFHESHVENDYFGIIEADGRHSEILFARDHVDNSGLIEAAQRGKVGLFASHVDNDYFGAIEAKGWDSQIDFGFDRVANCGIIAARWGGEIGFFASRIHNGYFGAMESVGKGSQVEFEFDFVDNRGLIGASVNGSLSIDDSWLHNAASGEIRADGRGAQVAFDDDGIANAGLIAAVSGGEIGFGGSDVDNDKPGLIEARGRAADVAFNDDHLDNSGRVAAAQGGAVDFYDSFIGNDKGGRIEAKGRSSQVAFAAGTVDNSGLVEARHHGQVWFANTAIDNARNGAIEAVGRGSQIDAWLGSVDNRGLIEARHGGTVELFATTVDNRSGVIAAVGRGAAIEFARSEIDGGLMRTAKGGLIETVADSGRSALDGVTIESGSHVEVTSGTTLLLDGGTTMTGGKLTIDTDGTLRVDPSLAILAGVDVINHGDIVIDPGVTTLMLEDGTTITGGNLHVGSAGALDIDHATLSHVDISDAGVVNIGSGDTFSSSTTINGSVTVEGGVLQIDGNVAIAAGATFAIDNTVALTEGQSASITFAGGTGELKLGIPASFTAAVHGFAGTAADTAHSDAIDLAGLDFASAHFSEIFNPASGLLHVTDGTNNASFTLTNFSGALDFASDGHGGTLITAQQAGSIGVAAGTIVELTGPSSGTVTFAAATGEFKIDNAADFGGHIDGFTGTAPDAQHSDVIDLAGLDYHSAQFVESYNSSTGSLSISDGVHSANFTFDNFTGTLDFGSDGHGGTLITDPPASSGAAAPQGGDSFKFNFPSGGGESWIGSDGPHEGTSPAHEALTSVLPQATHDDWLADPAHRDHLMPTVETVQQLHLQSAVHLH